MHEDDKQPPIQASWNQADAVKERLHNLTQGYNQSIISEQYQYAFNCLNLRFTEIYAKLTIEEIEKLDKYKKLVLPPLRRYIDEISEKNKPNNFSLALRRGGNNNIVYVLLDKLLEALDDYAKVVGKIEDVHGYGMPGKEGIETAGFR